MGISSVVQYAVAVCCVLTVLPLSSVAATWTPLAPPSYPLAVRSPYLSAWLPGKLASNLPSSSAQFWAGNDLGWAVIARVDGIAYNLFGIPSILNGTRDATVTQGTFTSTHSTFTLDAGSTTFTLDFLSPVSPKNYLRQSLPFSYLTVTVSGEASNVQIYSDIDDTWTGQSSHSQWDYSTTGSTELYQIRALGTATYSENGNGQALWGEAVYATRPGPSGKLSSASGPAAIVRSDFILAGSLNQSHVSWSPGGVVAFAHDLGSVTGGSASVTFAIGHVREQSVNYLGDAQTGYYRSKFGDTSAAVSHFLDDYDDALTESQELDGFIESQGIMAYGSNYSDILALSVRQVFGGMEITIPDDGSLDTSRARAFVKEISSDGNINTVDVIYATFPIFYVLNPDLIRLLITPVFEYMSSSLYTEAYAVHDLGERYPNATGHPTSGEAMPIEETGNVILLTYAYQHGSGKTDLATTYSSLLTKYAHYLQTNGEYPAAQLSLNDALGPLANQTNLGVKAAVGLAAYGALTAQPSYIRTGRDFAHTIWSKRLGTNPDGTYFTLQYHDNDNGNTSQDEPWFLVFNVYPDVLFNFDLFPETTYTSTSKFYPTVRSEAGVALDASIGWGQTNWQSYVAATVVDDDDDGGQSAREMFIADLHAYISNGINTAPFCDRYWVETGDGHVAGEAFAFRARPTLGSHFALLALKGGAGQW